MASLILPLMLLICVQFIVIDPTTPGWEGRHYFSQRQIMYSLSVVVVATVQSVRKALAGERWLD